MTARLIVERGLQQPGPPDHMLSSIILQELAWWVAAVMGPGDWHFTGQAAVHLHWSGGAGKAAAKSGR